MHVGKVALADLHSDLIFIRALDGEAADGEVEHNVSTGLERSFKAVGAVPAPPEKDDG